MENEHRFKSNDDVVFVNYKRLSKKENKPFDFGKVVAYRIIQRDYLVIVEDENSQYNNEYFYIPENAIEAKLATDTIDDFEDWNYDEV